MENKLFIVNPETDNIIISAPTWSRAVDMAFDKYHIKGTANTFRHKDWFRCKTMSEILLDMAIQINPIIENKYQWEIEIQDNREPVPYFCKSKLYSLESAIMDALSCFVGKFKYNIYYTFKPDSFYIKKVAKLDESNKEEWDLDVILKCCLELNRLYDGINETYEGFLKRGQFKETEI